MGEEVPEWATMWGAKVKMHGGPVDMPDDMLKDALETCSRIIDEHPDFENDGNHDFTPTDTHAHAHAQTHTRTVVCPPPSTHTRRARMHRACTHPRIHAYTHTRTHT